MTKWSVRKIWVATLGIGALTAALVCTYMSVSADTGLSVSGAKLVATASPGDIFTHQITVSIGSSDPPTDITLQVSPMAQYPDGTPRQSSDAGPYSASGFITLDKDSFHLDPGGSQTVTATISIPKDVGDGGRYALITVATSPPAGSTLSVITAVNVPIYITIKDSHLTHQGTINNISTDVSNNQAIAVVSVFENTGNHDFKVKNNLTLVDNQGQTVATANTSLSLWTIIPGMSREIKTELFPDVDLSPGLYRVTSQMTLDDGTILANGGIDLNLTTGISAVAAPVSTPPTSPLTTQALSNGVPLIPKSGTANWVFIVVIAGVALLALISYGVFKNRWLNRPATAVTEHTENMDHNTKTPDGVQLSSIIDAKEVPSALASASGVTQPPAIIPDSKEITISYFLTIRTHIGVGDLSVTPKIGNLYLVVNMNIENHGYESFKMYPRINTYAVIGDIKYSSALVLNLENRLPDEIVILNGENIEGKLAFEVPKDAALNRCQMTYENSFPHNIE
jgi:hypothetical protein